MEPHTQSLLEKLDEYQSSIPTSNPFTPLNSQATAALTKTSAFKPYQASSSYDRHTRSGRKYYMHHVPKLATSAARTRNSYLKHTVQPGSIVQFHGNSQLYKIFQFAKWESLVCYKYKFVCDSLVHEFYCNLEVGHGLNDENFFTTVLNGKPVLIDHYVISKALGFHYKISEKELLDVTSIFHFNKQEYHLYISTFCNCDVPESGFENDEGIPYEYFTPVFQNLALIFRANIFPKPNKDKLFNYLDLKLMFLLLNDKIEFNMSYFLLLNMINAIQESFMPYGMLLNYLFPCFNVDIQCFPSHKVTSVISEKTVRKQVPLTEYTSVVNPILNVPSCIADHAMVVSKVETFQLKVSSELEELKGMYLRAVHRADHLINVVNNMVVRVQMVEQSSENLYELLKKLECDDDAVVPNIRPGVSGMNSTDGNVGMNMDVEEGEITVNQ